jgi:hypothetical protein
VLQVEQALHGYLDGHRLLASSVDIPSSIRGELLVLTDLSGPRAVPGFSTYLTGYPVAEMAMFAIARTWLAEELPRPGCVWTHTLLVPWASLRTLGAGDLVRLHRRPKIQEGFEGFSIALEVEAQGLPTTRAYPLAPQVLSSLYSHLTASWIEADASGGDLEELLLAIWDQQWPALRRVFTFSSGSIGPRRIHDRLLDLQVVPADNSSSWLRTEARRIGPSSRRADWADLAAQDLVRPGRFREFLQAARTSKRTEYGILATAFEAIQDVETAKGLHDVLGNLREEYGDALPRVVGPLLQSQQWSSQDLVTGLLTWPGLDLALLKASKITTLIRHASKGESYDPWSIGRAAMSAADPNVRQAVLKAIAGQISPADLLERADDDRDLILSVIDARPELAAATQIWQTSVETRRSIVGVLMSRPRDGDAVSKLLRSAVAALSTESVISLARTWPAEAISAIVSAIRERKLSPDDAREYKQLLRSNASTVATALTSADQRDDDILTFLADNAIDPIGILSPWVAWAERQGCGSLPPRRAAFLMHLALTAPDAGAPQLLACVFDHVHDLAALDAIPERAWALIEPDLPHIGAFRDWDRCERIRRGAALASRRGRWSEDDFLRITSDPRVRRRLRELRYESPFDRG